uniref:Retrovirus-related Pol polyprotein from transposon TNT 1-94 n=1 Tax=Cajanus cajan TaxID=3821 RepID=A0A151T6S2_CAJCA|nr:Retrovirus-related Pol polyprotein from transposon TNT 1-94 [Cajanus cajan]
MTINVILFVALFTDWSVRQVDVNDAFLNGNIKEVVYMKPPEGFHNNNPNLVCRLNKTIYVLKQTPRAWFGKLVYTLVSFRFV